MIGIRRRPRRAWLAALLLAPVLGPALDGVLAGTRPEAGCACAGSSCCARVSARSCCPLGHSTRGSCARSGGAANGLRFSVTCGCEHPAPLGSAGAREQPALLGTPVALARPSSARATTRPGPRPGPPAASSPDPPPPRPFLSRA